MTDRINYHVTDAATVAASPIHVISSSTTIPERIDSVARAEKDVSASICIARVFVQESCYTLTSSSSASERWTFPSFIWCLLLCVAISSHWWISHQQTEAVVINNNLFFRLSAKLPPSPPPNVSADGHTCTIFYFYFPNNSMRLQRIAFSRINWSKNLTEWNYKLQAFIRSIACRPRIGPRWWEKKWTHLQHNIGRRAEKINGNEERKIKKRNKTMSTSIFAIILHFIHVIFIAAIHQPTSAH